MLYAIVAILIFAMGAGSAVKVEEWRFAAKEAAQVQAQHDAQVAADKRSNTIAGQFTKAIADLKSNSVATNARVLNELSQAVYTQCVLPDSGRLLLDSSADDLNRAAGLGAAVPSPAAPAPKPAGQVNNGGSGDARQGLDAAIRRLRDTATKATGSGSGSAGPGK